MRVHTGIRRASAWSTAVACSLLVAGCGPVAAGGGPRAGMIAVVAAENTYGSVASQVGGRYVVVTSVESNPSIDPHSYEVSPSVAQAVSTANVVVQNGGGYDAFMNSIEAASPSATRHVVDVQHLLGLPDTTSNPHFWYSPTTMPKVAAALAAALTAIAPSHASYFAGNASRFDASLAPWRHAIARLGAIRPAVSVATTEPVADGLLAAAGAANLTPMSFQLDVMNGIDPSPQDVSLESSLLTQHRVRVLVYNEQVTDTLTQSFITAAVQAHVPVVGVYETMPTPGYTYQTWMLAETSALLRAIDDHASTAHL